MHSREHQVIGYKMRNESQYIAVNKNMPVQSPYYRTFHLFQLRPGYTLFAHKHEFHHMNFILQGQVTITTPQEEITVTQGNAVLIPCRTEHALYSEEGYLQIGVDIYPLADLDGYYELFSHTLATKSETLSVVPIHNYTTPYETLDRLCSQFSQRNNLEIIQEIRRMMLLVVENSQPTPNHEFRNAFFDMLTHHNPYTLTLDDMCQHLNVSKSHLGRLCQGEFDCSPVEYCNKLRLMQACRLLETTDLNLQQISEKLYFHSASHFIVFFKNRKEQTPTEYRDEYLVV